MAETRQAEVIAFFRSLQDSICEHLERLDGGGTFREDTWERPGGGGGRTRILEGELIEKGGVNFSAVHGELGEAAAAALHTESGHFLATGVSIVLHPRNPWTPIIHMNVRYFELEGGNWWFGGGIDLTPHYVIPELAEKFHKRLAHVFADYPDYDHGMQHAHADDYFFIRHRHETRGIGGIFFDRLDHPSFTTAFGFTRAVGEAFDGIYSEQLRATKDLAYGERELTWQRLRRGRYVEFNLVWDRGTRFGLETEGRTESILMSLPPRADWVYEHHVEAGSQEERTQGYLRKNIDWLNPVAE